MTLLPDKPDSRDYLCKSDAAYPPIVDLSRYVIDIEDQSYTNSCTAHAGTTCVEVMEKLAGASKGELSRLFLYYTTRVISALQHQDGGAYMRDIGQALVNQGICLESSWPFVEGNVQKIPSMPAYEEADKKKAQEYRRINVGDWRSMKSMLGQGYPILLGMWVHPAFMNLRGTLATHSEAFTEEKINPVLRTGSHAMVIVGYNDELGYWLVANSWGAMWGDKGFCAIPYKTLDLLAHDLWIISKFNNLTLPKPIIRDKARAAEIKGYLGPVVAEWKNAAIAYDCQPGEVDDAMGWADGTFDRITAGL
jgi:C1A family cysteine protease